jgi:hypothetical protein
VTSQSRQKHIKVNLILLRNQVVLIVILVMSQHFPPIKIWFTISKKNKKYNIITIIPCYISSIDTNILKQYTVNIVETIRLHSMTLYVILMLLIYQIKMRKLHNMSVLLE